MILAIRGGNIRSKSFGPFAVSRSGTPSRWMSSQTRQANGRSIIDSPFPRMGAALTKRETAFFRRPPMHTRVRFSKLLAMMLLFVCSIAASAQTITGGINGIVTDSSGAVLPNAKVVATSVETNVETTATTNNDGVYNIRFLQIGHYKVSIEAPGFATTNFGPFTIETGQNAKVDAKLALAGTESKVTVESELLPLPNSENPTLATTLDTR